MDNSMPQTETYSDMLTTMTPFSDAISYIFKISFIFLTYDLKSK